MIFAGCISIFGLVPFMYCNPLGFMKDLYSRFGEKDFHFGVDIAYRDAVIMLVGAQTSVTVGFHFSVKLVFDLKAVYWQSLQFLSFDLFKLHSAAVTSPLKQLTIMELKAFPNRSIQLSQ